MKIRELQLEDTFTLSEVLEKMDFQADLNKLFDESKKHPDAQSYLGGQFFLSFAKNWHRAKDEILRFISDLSGESIDTIKKLKFKEIKEVITQLFSDEEMQDFIKRVSEELK